MGLWVVPISFAAELHPHLLDGLVRGLPCVGESYLRMITSQILLLVGLGTGDVFMTSATSLTLLCW